MLDVLKHTLLTLAALIKQTGTAVIVFLLLTLDTTNCQDLRNFPPLFNTAQERPLTTVPAQSTCGIPTRIAYCKSGTLLDSINQCKQDYCDQECPQRTSLPEYQDLLEPGGFGPCVNRDTVNRRPGSSASQFSAAFQSRGTLCYVTPSSRPSLGANGAFTVTFWIWQEQGNSGTVLEKFSSTSSSVVLSVRVSSSTVTFTYKSVFGQRQVQFLDTLPSSTWSHLSIQVYDTTVSYFVNGVGAGDTAAGTKGLVGSVRDEPGTFRIGQTHQGQNQFLGRLQEVRFYSTTLTNREIAEVYSGTFPPVHIQSDCRCPATHPRVKPQETRLCIANGVPDNFGDEIVRLNDMAHPLEYLNDGDSNSLWVSADLDDISIEVNLGDQFQVFYVVLQFYSPQPKVVTIEKRSSAGAAWERWQMYAEDCLQAFGMPNNGPLPEPTSVNCIQFGTNGLQVPYSKGNITFSVLSPEPVPRPGHNDFYNTPQLAEFVKASHLRVRLQGHYYVSHPRHRYYGVYEYIVTGRCNCHGHAEVCDRTGPNYSCQCYQESFTQGDQCQSCLPLYNDKPFRAGDQLNDYHCKPCQCYGHADSCVYDVNFDLFPDDHNRGGGGVCQGCQHNTMGRMCDTCMAFFFRAIGKSLYATDVCEPCDCNAAGVEGGGFVCDKNGGQCSCKEHVTGRACDQCESGYYNLQQSNPMGCEPCACEPAGTVNSDVACQLNQGQCNCKRFVRGTRCNLCQYGYYNLDTNNPDGCTSCDCNPIGATDQFCDPGNGQCNCQPNVQGQQCDQCADGYYDFADQCRKPCDCNPEGTEPGTVCDKFTGQCVCKEFVTGRQCSQCLDGYHALGRNSTSGCVSCGCHPAGMLDTSEICDKVTGECRCKANVMPGSCNQCRPNTFNLDAANPDGCQPCGCDPSGTLRGDQSAPNELTCDQNTGNCTCLAHRVGRACDVCSAGYFADPTPGGGCDPCDCHRTGSIAATNCNPVSGQCICKGGRGIGGRRCDSCAEGNFHTRSGPNCAACECDPAGSVNDTCRISDGQCECKLYTTGRQCGVCRTNSSNLQADNPYGCSKAPSQQPPPDYDSMTSTSVRLYWQPPDYPNGVILWYELRRDGRLIATIQSDDRREYNDTSLAPYTEYGYTVSAVNDFGSTRSPVVRVRTKAGTPSGDITLTVSNIGTTSATFFWNRPSSANGLIEEYQLTSTTSNRPSTEIHYKGLGLSVRLRDLTPYTLYLFRVSACTRGGCLTSEATEVLTDKDEPEGQMPPNVTAVSSTELFVEWQPPLRPNGIIIFYELWMRGDLTDNGVHDPPAKRIFHPAGWYNPLPTVSPQEDPLPPPALNYTVEDLEPYTVYEFQVLSENSQGKTASEWVRESTLEAEPTHQPAPTVNPVSSHSLNVSWESPGRDQARGEVLAYTLYLYKMSDLDTSPHAPPYVWTVIHTGDPSIQSFLAEDFQPYTLQRFRVQVCNSVGCVNSSDSLGRTLPDAPEDQQPADVEGYNSSVMQVTWKSVNKPNSPSIQYRVHRFTPAFNNPPPVVTIGTRFPGNGYYMFAPETIPQGVAFTGIDLWFKTTERDGLMLFAASEGGQEEFVAIQLSNGRPWFLFDPQGCPITVTPDIDGDDENVTFSDGMWHHLVVNRFITTALITVDTKYTGCSLIVTTTDDEGLPYNDGKWHHMIATRSGKNGLIVMDDDWKGEKVGDCARGNIIGDNTGVYIGGLPDDYILQREENDKRAEVVSQNFMGCIRDIKIMTQQVPEKSWRSLSWDDRLEAEGAMPSWEGCPVNLEPATHFLGTGFLAYAKEFEGGSEFGFDFEMRTQQLDGLLFFAHGGPGVYFLVQLVSGGLHVEFSNDVIKRVVLFSSRDTLSMCDGHWHKIEIRKDGKVLSVTVDRIGPQVAGESTARTHLFLTSELHIGGIKQESDAAEFIRDYALVTRVQKSFGGCLKNVRISGRVYKLAENHIGLQGVILDGCPAVETSYIPCLSSSSQVVYDGNDTRSADDGLHSFTAYLYQIEAYNDIGSTFSSYSVGRTREGVPEGVTGPYDVKVISGYVIDASWRHPTGRTGQLTHYILRAYNLDNSSAPPVETVFEDTSNTSGSIVSAQPFTNYSVVFVACTAAGCTESLESVRVLTNEEAPDGVSPPEATERGGTYLVLSWSVPRSPNGQITGYFLFWEDEEIYSGGQMSYNITELSVYTTYNLFVRACTQAGCTDSETARLSTAQLPPTAVAPPRLLVMGTRRVRVDWDHPDQLNGVLERYLLYTSTEAGELGPATYNSTDLFLYYSMEDLLAGTTYYISLGACTGGGCTTSQASSATTEESAPDGVRDPVVTSPSPSELLVTWSVPEFPNGVITFYRLYHNSLDIFTDETAQMQHLISGLSPWSLHRLRLEACTARGCSSSDEVEARTQEAPPEGAVGLDLLIDGQRRVRVNWNAVGTPNGRVIYKVFFEGLFYVDPDQWDYSTRTERRSLYETETAGSWEVIDKLIPYSTYSIQVEASNSKGTIYSNVKQAEMPMGSPDGVAPPTLTSPTSTTIRAVWQAVGRANAAQDPAFQLQFKTSGPGAVIEDLFPQPTTSTTYVKGGLQAFTQYEFRLIAINAYGETLTEWTALTTRQDKPTSIDPPMTSNIQTRALDIYWVAPLQPNGIVTHYNIYGNGNLLERVDGNVTRWTVEDLLPFHSYTFEVEACTVAGCTKSAQSTVVKTLQASPEGVPAPILVSQTPTSVLIVWDQPAEPNGDILQYSVQRRLPGSPIITTVQTFTPDQRREYVDEDKALTPYTTYEYGIVAITLAGRGSSPWVQVTTKSSGPGGVESPQVRVLSPTSAEVTWKPPRQPNGILEYYVIKFPKPRFEISNVSITYLMVENLVPYTEYFVSLTACSDGGCTESMPTKVTTNPSIPTGLDPPTGTPHSQSFISVLWNPPGNPNGPNIRYELSRMKLQQPLDPSATGFNIWTSIYIGQDTYYEDRGLTIYTTFQYRVTVYNDFGHVTSNPSAEVTTYGGTPTRAAVVSVFTVNHTAIEVTWVTPSIFELQGGVSKFVVTVTEGSTIVRREYDPGVTEVVLNEFRPNTRYGITVTIVVHGGATITSEQVYTTTQDGAPAGLAPPYLHMVNETALRVIWAEPEQPNGEILSYNLYVDGEKIETGFSTPASYVLANLEPYTIYLVQVEVCTEYACVKSSATKGTTAESVPSGVKKPGVSVRGPTAIMINWVQPAELNGILLRYELLMRAKIPCSDRPQPTVEPPAGKCTYYECSIMESFCDGQCYSGPKVCCEGALYDIRTGYECCGRHYIPQRADFTDVCCRGQFYPRLTNHQCCGNRYMPVNEDQTCCLDPDEDRVDIGYGDVCCGSVPFASNGSQICCQGKLYDRYQQQCCGGQVVADHLTCCGDHGTGSAYEYDTSKECCGQDYMMTSTSVCCRDTGTGHTRVHTYISEEEKAAANEKCCGTERISNGLSCCNGVGYSPRTQVCADVSDQESGCGSGVVCSVRDSSSAFCNRCNFDQNRQKCGSVSRGSLTMTPEGGTEDPDSSQDLMCITEPVKIYTGTEYSFLHTDLSPYMEYQYAVTAVNAAGGSTSDYSEATTAQTLPQGVHAPQVTVQPNQLYAVYLNWQPPETPNGEVLWYILIRDGFEIFRDPSALEHVDNNAIQPYRTYTYSLQICNGAGCTTSPQVKIATLQAKPNDVSPPMATATSATSLQVTWSPPGQPNGFITRYELYMLDRGKIASVSGSTRQYFITELQPYGLYELLLSACTDVGCTNSSTISARTMQDKPEGVFAPDLVVQDASTVEIYWVAPDQINGVLVAYRVYRALEERDWVLVYTGGAGTLSFTDPTLAPGGRYRYLVEAANGAGATNSTAVSVTMPTETPPGIPAPSTVRVLNSTAIYVEWEPLPESAGVIDQYKVVLNAGTSSTKLEDGVGLVPRATVVGLKPYTVYIVRVQACLRGLFRGCGTGPGVTVQTLEAPPQGQQAPVLTAVGPSSIQISWSPPQSPNGVIVHYHIHRRVSGTNSQGLLINVLEGSTTGFTNMGPDLIPYTQYDYKVTARNAEGESVSPWATVQTLEAPPQVLYAPLVTVVSGYSITLSWQPPLQTNGVITRYKIQYREVNNDPTSSPLIKAVTMPGTVFQTSVSGLRPYTPHEVRVVAQNSAGEVASSWTRTTTNEAAPSGIQQFTVEQMMTGTSIILRWDSPKHPNGIINNYLIFEGGSVNAIYQGLSREFEYRRLQPYKAYELQLEACTHGGCARSDVQTVQTAEVIPEDQPAPSVSSANATHVTLEWRPPVNPFGQIVLYELLRRSSARIQKREVSDPEVVYSTTDTDRDAYQYTDSGLQAYTTYDYSVRASNSKGSVQSSWQTVETSQAAPEGVDPPRVTQISSQHDRLRVQWSAPRRANGVIQTYQIKRNNSAPWSFAADDVMEYVDTGLVAFTYYSYTLTVLTGGGYTTSEPTITRTPETAPYHIDPPEVTVLSSTELRLTWAAPQITNGEVETYHLYQDEDRVYSGLNLAFTVEGLTPYKAYTFRVSSCTLGGCTNSESVVGRPLEAAPTDMSAPVLRVLGSNSIEISWQAPQQPNGIITSYELRRGDTLIQRTTNVLQYVDYTVEPGKTYTYRVTAYNSEGEVTSPPASERTYSSAPQGMAPPELEAVSATSIRASWAPPLKPNGNITNYNLLVDNKEFPSRQLSMTVTQLQPWTEYAARVQACTNQGCTLSDAALVRTLEAAPTNLQTPKLTSLSDVNGAHAGVEVKWTPPRYVNGIINKYEVYRRKTSDGRNGDTSLVYTGLANQTVDNSPALSPYTEYDYKITAYNSAGFVNSLWETVLTKEAPPEGVPQPEVKSKTSTTITIELFDPERLNGNLQHFNIYLNGQLVAKIRYARVHLGENDPLEPYTLYTIYVEACTAGGCTPSPSVQERTKPRTPQGVQPPRLGNITTTSMDVFWSAPADPNGEIVTYELYMRTSCPQPYSDDDDQVNIPCTAGSYTMVARGLQWHAHVTSLQPYTLYQFKLDVLNEAGGLEQPPTVSNNTLPAGPVYNKEEPPTMQPEDSNTVHLDWTLSFFINGEVSDFTLYKDDNVLYKGFSTNYNAPRASPYKKYRFRVVLTTSHGQAQTPVIIFDPTDPQYGVLSSTSGVVVEPTKGEEDADDIPVYQEVWFIALIALTALAILFIALAVCIRNSGHKVPYLRERMPLQPKQKKAAGPLAFCAYDPYGESMTNEIQVPVLPAHATHVPTGYANPSYSHLSVPSRPASLVDLHLDRLSQKSSHWDEEEEDVDIPWGDQQVRNDSGLHSLAYGDDYDAASDRPISVLKEHTMFSDTHL